MHKIQPQLLVLTSTQLNSTQLATLKMVANKRKKFYRTYLGYISELLRNSQFFFLKVSTVLQ